MRLNTWAAARKSVTLYDPRSVQVRRPCENTRQAIATMLQGQTKCTSLGITHGWLAIKQLPSQCEYCGASL